MIIIDSALRILTGLYAENEWNAESLLSRRSGFLHAKVVPFKIPHVLPVKQSANLSGFFSSVNAVLLTYKWPLIGRREEQMIRNKAIAGVVVQNAIMHRTR